MTSVNMEVIKPGTTATVLSARSTRIVLSAAKLPSGKAIVTYLPNSSTALQ